MATSRRGLWQILNDAVRRRRNRVRACLGLAADERGVTAIEFGLLSFPFFGLVAAILETGVIFLAIQVMDSAVNDSSRLIRTGQAQEQGYQIGDFREAICERSFGLFECSGYRIRVTPVGTFSNAARADSVVDTDDGSWDLDEIYSPGPGSAVVMVEVYYKWPTFMDFFGINFASLPDSTMLMTSVHIFRNEPFG